MVNNPIIYSYERWSMPLEDEICIFDDITLMFLIKQPKKSGVQEGRRELQVGFSSLMVSNLSDPVLGRSSLSTLPFQPRPAPYGRRPGSVGVEVGVWGSQENDKPQSASTFQMQLQGEDIPSSKRGLFDPAASQTPPHVSHRPSVS